MSKLDIYETFARFVMNRSTLVGIMVIAILWRAFISSDGSVILWESTCSGIILLIMGWTLFAYILSMSRGLKGWLELNTIYRWIAVSLFAINIYVIIYYGMRWYRLMSMTETYVPMDLPLRDIRYILLILYYCVVIWLAKHLKKVYNDYTMLFKATPEM